MPKAQIVISGGRVPLGHPEREDGPTARGVDIGVFAVVDGRRTLLDGRKAIATVELFVDEVEVTSVEAQVMGINAAAP